MKYKMLKNMRVSQLGYGTWPLAGSVPGAVAYGDTNDDDSKNALLTAFERGVNIYDTADFYGYGHVESLLGSTFEHVRDKIFIITKGGLISNLGEQNFSKDHLTNSLLNSLKRLRTDYIDIYMLHSPQISILKDGELIELLNGFKKSGKIREYGISVISPHDGKEAISKYNFDIIEVNFNLLDQRCIINGLFDLCVEKNVSTIIRTPLYQGLLTGKFNFNKSESDLRNKWSKEKTEFLMQSVNRLLLHTAQKNISPVQNSLRFCLSHEAVTSIIPGMKTPSEVIENTFNDVFDLFSEEELRGILREYNNMGL